MIFLGRKAAGGGGPTSFPVTNSGGALGTVPGTQRFGFAIPATNNLWLRWTANLGDTDSYAPLVVLRSGGATGTIVAAFRITSGNNAYELCLVTAGGLATGIAPFGLTCTSLVTDFGGVSGGALTQILHFQVATSASLYAYSGQYASPATATANTSGARAATVDYVGFCDAGTASGGTISAITADTASLAL